MFADILNRPVETVNGDALGALGIAMTAGIGAGVYKDYADAARQAVTVRARFEPDPDRHAAYMKRYEQWTELIGCMSPFWNR